MFAEKLDVAHKKRFRKVVKKQKKSIPVQFSASFTEMVSDHLVKSLRACLHTYFVNVFITNTKVLQNNNCQNDCSLV